jgi:GxxExxY protein
MASVKIIEDELTHSVLGAFYEVYNILDFGFLEHVYVAALERELRSRGHTVDRELAVRVMYKGEDLCSQRLDIVVDDRLILEVKSSAILPATTMRQLYSYLKATNIEIGLVLHFGPEAKFYRQILTNDRKNHAERLGYTAPGSTTSRDTV